MLEIFGKTIQPGKAQNFEYKVLCDTFVKSVYISPFTQISFVNITTNEIIVNAFKFHESYRGVNWIISKAPDKRGLKINKEFKKGDILRFKIETFRSAENKTQILFIT
ncbi:MAG: hypothetical protein JXR68_12750 [Bacteroidales bacterium]|nr:hypothetical protein [Bacteroidales bacterium]